MSERKPQGLGAFNSANREQPEWHFTQFGADSMSADVLGPGVEESEGVRSLGCSVAQWLWCDILQPTTQIIPSDRFGPHRGNAHAVEELIALGFERQAVDRSLD